MKYCPGCKVKVGGNFEHCPLCQNALQGEGEKNVFPYSVNLHRESILFKIQLFISLSALVILLALDFLLKMGERHWSIIALVAIFALQMVLQAIIKRRPNPSKLVWHITVASAGLVAYIFYFVKNMPLYLEIILPSICLVSLGAHFVFSMADKARNALIYYLVNILAALLPAVVFLIIRKEVPVLWSVCLMAGVVSLLALVIFRGRRVTSELQKRFNF